jgi:cell wall-associated NlpC family hydrolase
MITNELKFKIKEYSLLNKSEESCGLILNIHNSLDIYKCRNISYHKKNHAILNPYDYIKASKLGKIVGHFHSQPTGEISYLDYINASGHNLNSIIYIIDKDKFYLINPDKKDYLNLDYKCGVSDCYSLVRNYFKKELNIQLNDYNREDGWWKVNPNLILENFTKEDGIEVEFKDIKVNDILAFEIAGATCHFAIYLGNNFILHHPINDKSVIGELSEALIKRIKLVIRHKNLF